MGEKLRISFVQPLLSLKERYGTLGQLGYVEPPIGLCYLAAVAREKGFEVQIVDAQASNLNLEQTISAILSFGPSLVGITAVSQLIVNAASLAEEIKKNNPQIITMLGGCHLTALPKETMEQFPFFDIGVLGEGEDTLSELLDALVATKDIYSIRGIIARKNNNLIQTEPRPKILDLDRLPFPALDLLPRLEKYYRVCVQSCSDGPTISLNTSRGCPSKCTFCDSSVHGQQLRYHSAGYVFQLLKQCIDRYNVKNFFFNDSNFFLPFSRFRELADLINRNGLKIKWSCMSRIDAVNEEILYLARKVGCQQILYGIESGSQEILNIYRKGITLKNIKNNLFLTKKAGITTKGFFIFGGPGETKETIKLTTNFMREIDLDDVGVSLFVPFAGSDSYKNISEYGTFLKDWQKMSTYIPVFIPYGFSEKKLLKYVKIAYRNFYFRSPIIISYLRRCSNIWQIKNFFLAGLVFLHYIFFEKHT